MAVVELWKKFVVSMARVIEISDVVIVDYDIEQDMEAPPNWAGDAPSHTRSFRSIRVPPL